MGRPLRWHAARAGGGGRRRGIPRFRERRPVPEGAILVDDVLTTGTTLAAAAAVLGVRRAVVATVASRVLAGTSG